MIGKSTLAGASAFFDVQLIAIQACLAGGSAQFRRA
jgi:hypothetical protein